VINNNVYINKKDKEGDTLMTIEKNLTPAEAISKAIKAEIEMFALYKKFEDRTKNSRLKSQYKYLATEEKKHRELLEGIFKRQFPHKKLELPSKSMVPNIEKALNEDLTSKELFKIAMESEKMARDFYIAIADKTTHKKAKTWLHYLSNVEQNHFNILKADYELLLEIPEYFELDELISDDWNLAQ
jgi:rubrerythrin